MSGSATVSVVVTCRDEGHYLDSALASIALASTRPETVEVIVVDAGSTDPNTERLFSEIASRDREGGFRLIARNDAGTSGARNAGTRTASGDWLIFMEADDLLSPATIDLRLSIAHQRSADVVVTDYASCNEDQTSFSRPERATVSQGDLNFLSVSRCWERGVYFPMHAAMFRRELILALPFDEASSGGQDWVFWMRLLSLTEKTEFIATVGCVERAGSVDSTDENGAVAWMDAMLTAKRDIPEFKEAEQRLAMEYLNTVHLDRLRNRFGSSLPERFYGALFSGLAAA